MESKLKTNYYLRNKLDILRNCRTQPKGMIKKLTTLFLLALAAPGMAQSILSSFFPGTSEGVTYHLPDTKINITVEARCITHTPGEFYSYAERFLHIKNVIAEASNRWEIANITSTSEGMPNKSKAFTVRLGSSTASNIVLNEKGIICAINTNAADRQNVSKEGKLQSKENSNTAQQYMTEEMLTATSTAKMAELTAKEIYAIRESKLAITRGQAENMPSDGAAITLLLQELDKQEKALTELFTGRTDTVCHTYSYHIAPSEVRDTTKAVLLRFSQKLGVVDKENLAGEPIYYNIKDLKTVILPVTDETEQKKPTKVEGILYNIPGRASLTIYSRTRTFMDKEIPIAQFGITELLSKSLFGKNNTTKVLFDTATGGIISINRD